MAMRVARMIGARRAEAHRRIITLEGDGVRKEKGGRTAGQDCQQPCTPNHCYYGILRGCISRADSVANKVRLRP